MLTIIESTAMLDSIPHPSEPSSKPHAKQKDKLNDPYIVTHPYGLHPKVTHECSGITFSIHSRHTFWIVLKLKTIDFACKFNT